MDLEKFIKERPYLYHLTSKENAPTIIAQRRLYSTNRLIEMAGDEAYFLIQRQKRPTHYRIEIEGTPYFLRDQRPISEKALAKCLTDNWTVGDFLYHLNDRVFMWPTLERLRRHYDRYQEEEPVIFRFPTAELLALNEHALFCRLNSGATRANSYLGGKAPERGSQTFLPAHLFNHAVRDVAEVTFQEHCNIDVTFSIASVPDGNFQEHI